MSTPVKPPGGTRPYSGPEALSGVTSTPAATEVDKSAAVKPTASVESVATVGSPADVEFIKSISEQLRAGALDRAQAIEQLVNHTIEQQGAGWLDASQKAELQALLTRSLEDNPTLQALLRGLDDKF